LKRGAGALLACVLVACSSTNGSTGGNGAGGTSADGGVDATTPSLVDAGGVSDATSAGDAPTASEASAGCGPYAGDPVFTCSADGTSRGKCVDDASLDDEPCPNGCLIEPAGQDAICMGADAGWSCTGSYGTTPAQDGNYYLSEFGCWVDDAGVHTDPDDNCIPSCLDQAVAAGLCDAGGSGADCEEGLDWYTADGARFGCLQRLRVTNPANGKSLIAIALDFGPSCAGESTVDHAVLDSSGQVNDYLFGGRAGRATRRSCTSSR